MLIFTRAPLLVCLHLLTRTILELRIAVVLLHVMHLDYRPLFVRLRRLLNDLEVPPIIVIVAEHEPLPPSRGVVGTLFESTHELDVIEVVDLQLVQFI